MSFFFFHSNPWRWIEFLLCLSWTCRFTLNRMEMLRVVWSRGRCVPSHSKRTSLVIVIRCLSSFYYTVTVWTVSVTVTWRYRPSREPLVLEEFPRHSRRHKEADASWWHSSNWHSSIGSCRRGSALLGLVGLTRTWREEGRFVVLWNRREWIIEFIKEAVQNDSVT